MEVILMIKMKVQWKQKNILKAYLLTKAPIYICAIDRSTPSIDRTALSMDHCYRNHRSIAQASINGAALTMDGRVQ